jgi:cyclin K
MPCWYFDKHSLRDTPSLKDAIDFDKETRYRREGAQFIMECGGNMGLRRDTMATGVVFFHRFYMIHSFAEFPRHVMATCCLFLAGKVEETPKKCKDIVKAAKLYLDSKNLEKYWISFGEDPLKEIMIYERILLQTIKFDLQVDHPYQYLLKYAKTLKGDQESIRNMVQMTWTFINDSYSTTLCLQWEPEIIAIALMYLTSKLSKFEITDWVTKEKNSKQKWWEQFVEDLGVEILEDICHQVLDLYQSKQQQQQQQQSISMEQNTKQTPQKRQSSVALTDHSSPAAKMPKYTEPYSNKKSQM